MSGCGEPSAPFGVTRRRGSRWLPANIPNLPGHNWANSIAMATPLGHKGVLAGAKVQAMNLLDLLTKPELIAAACDYFNNVPSTNLP
jgi:aminobenzoyl-glutamate utilization protein B